MEMRRSRSEKHGTAKETKRNAEKREAWSSKGMAKN